METSSDDSDANQHEASANSESNKPETTSADGDNFQTDPESRDNGAKPAYKPFNRHSHQ